ncbi:uncharacterized protein LOC142336884 isoform X2 [Convolutriloba macropyga]|uniref:uncharacterized protein LOC142336884 isoform X2 n=1 Tax=Convolutriloba macropyga TaxID=536237 RepID=UPI003F526A24
MMSGPPRYMSVDDSSEDGGTIEIHHHTVMASSRSRETIASEFSRHRQTLNDPPPPSEDRIISYTNSMMTVDPEGLRSTMHSSFRPDISLNDSNVEIRIDPNGQLERSLVNSVLGELVILDEEHMLQGNGSPADEKARKSLMRYDKCVKQLLGWYHLEHGSGCCFTRKLVCHLYNKVYPCIVIFLLLCYYVLSIWLCITPTPTNDDKDEYPHRGSSSENASSNDTDCYQQCDNILSNYALDYLINLLLYLALLWYTRWHRSESLYIALEKVFMRAQKSQIGKLQTPKFVLKLRLFVLTVFLIGAISWLCMVYVYVEPTRLKFTFSDQNNKVFQKFNNTFQGMERTAMIAAIEACMLLGALFYFMIYVVLVMHYFWFCAVVTFHVQCLVSDILQRAVALQEAIRDAQAIQASVSSLNGFPSKVSALALLAGVDNFAFELYKLSLLRIDYYDNIVFRLVMTLFWLFTFSSILIPACLITEQARRLRKAAAEMRAFGYPQTNTTHLDSFLTYLSIIRIQPKLLYIHIHTSWVAGAYLFSFLILLFLTKVDFLFGNLGNF